MEIFDGQLAGHELVMVQLGQQIALSIFQWVQPGLKRDLALLHLSAGKRRIPPLHK
jgi:hypothetical protein